MSFITVDECIAQLLQSAIAYPIAKKISETPLLDATDLVLAEDIVSSIDVPPADNSAMDGYAVLYADASLVSELPISQRIQAGDVASPLIPKTATRIFTGAEIPAGADTVVMQEDCSVDGDRLKFNQAIKPNKNIRKQGQDIKQGATILKQGSVLRAQDIGLLASIGVTGVKTYQPLRVAIVNTGNELVEPGQPLAKGQIYNSNRFLVDSVLRGWGFEVSHCDIVVDSLTATQASLKKLSCDNDIIISTGGVSVGEEDYIKPAVSKLGGLDLWKVAIKPGKPFAFGHVADTPFIGLPGNPASVFVTLLTLARPYLLAQQGVNEKLQLDALYAKANFNRQAGSRDEYLRANVNNGLVDIYANQSSGVLQSASWGNGLALQKAGDSIREGDLLPFYFYSALLGQ